MRGKKEKILIQHGEDIYGMVIQQHVDKGSPTLWWMNEVGFQGKIQRMKK